MKARAAMAFLCFLLAGITLGAFGLLYLFSPKFMPYHSDAIGVTWEELTPRYQALLLALLKSVGGGFLGSSVAFLTILFIPYRARAAWARWALLGIGLVVSFPALYATLIVKYGTPASPPWYAAALGIVLTIVGFVLSTSTRPEGLRRIHFKRL